MSYKVENLENSMAKITIEVSPEAFEEAMKKSYNKNKNKIALPGFRKGKAPRKLIEKEYGPEVFYEDAANFVIPDAYEEAAKESGLEIVSRPDIDVEKIGNGEPFVFTATVAVKPDVELGDYKGIEVEKQEVKIMAADVNAELAKVQEQNARTVNVEDRAIKKDDIAVIDFEGFVDDEPFDGGKGTDYSLTIGSHSFIDTFEDQLIGKNKGDKVDVNVTFPETYHVEELKGKPALFKVEIKDIKMKELPKLDDEFASEVSEFETLKEYKASVKKTLTERRKNQVKAEKEDKIISKVVENSKIELPKPMVDEQINQMINEFASRLQQQGLSIEQYIQMTGMQPQMMMEQMRPEAETRIRTRLVLEAVAAAEGIKATAKDIDKEIERLQKEEQRLTKELARVNGMLSNERFMSKAPESKVAEERAKLEKYSQMMDQVKERLTHLQAR